MIWDKILELSDMMDEETLVLIDFAMETGLVPGGIRARIIADDIDPETGESTTYGFIAIRANTASWKNIMDGQRVPVWSARNDLLRSLAAIVSANHHMRVDDGKRFKPENVRAQISIDFISPSGMSLPPSILREAAVLYSDLFSPLSSHNVGPNPTPEGQHIQTVVTLQPGQSVRLVSMDEDAEVDVDLPPAGLVLRRDGRNCIVGNVSAEPIHCRGILVPIPSREENTEDPSEEEPTAPRDERRELGQWGSRDTQALLRSRRSAMDLYRSICRDFPHTSRWNVNEIRQHPLYEDLVRSYTMELAAQRLLIDLTDNDSWLFIALMQDKRPELLDGVRDSPLTHLILETIRTRILEMRQDGRLNLGWDHVRLHDLGGGTVPFGPEPIPGAPPRQIPGDSNVEE